MRKLLIASVFVSLCMADFAAFAANPRTARGGGTNNATTANATGAAPVAARAGARKKVVSSGGSAVTSTATTAKPVATTAARAGKKQTVVATGAVKKARAGATQKVINAGTKVAAATENTTVDKECQDAFYGCMDTFCMLDNTSGGRCQCSDRGKELDLVLEEIMKLDEQSLAMATEGVERIQMGESADEIMARAKSAANRVVNGDSGKSDGVSNKTKARQLDLSAWKNTDMFDDDSDDFSVEVPSMATNTFADKKGDALYSSVTDLCVKQVPKKCSGSLSFLQLAYTQKIRSDCAAYENSLKQRREASAEKLQTAQKALRDAALEAYQNENMYDFGECVVRFKQCMQTTGECGTDFSGCIADTAILDTLYNKKSGKGTATKSIKTGVTTVTISSATYDILNTKKIMCESVTKQCVNANKKGEVWEQVIKDLAPVVYTAEYNAASNNRMNCISTVVNCVQKSCGSKWDDNTDNFDACLSDPNSIDNYCKLEYQRCGDGDIDGNGSGTMGSVKSYIMAKLAALKVDKCTQDVKACLLSEDRCGPDYTGCIGLDTDSIIDLCSTDSLISCQTTKGTNGSRSAEDVREYIAQIAQGLALSIDNKMATTCQNAVDAAVSRVCGDTLDMAEDDPNATFSCPALIVGAASLKDSMRVVYVDRKQDLTKAPSDKTLTAAGSNRKFYTSIDEFIESEHLSADNGERIIWSLLKDKAYTDTSIKRILDLEPMIIGKMDIFGIKYTGNEKGYFEYKSSNSTGNDSISADNGYTNNPDELVAELDLQYKQLIDQIKSDKTVDRCVNGKSAQGISSRTKANRGEGDKSTIEGAVRFENLTKSAEKQLAAQAINSAISKYNVELESAKEKLVGAYTDFADNLAGYLADAELDALNKKACEANQGVGLGCIDKFWTIRCGAKYRHVTTAFYDSVNHKCTINRTTYYCSPSYYYNDVNYIKNNCNLEKVHDPVYINYSNAKTTTTEQ